jgi:hypothetical protein
VAALLHPSMIDDQRENTGADQQQQHVRNEQWQRCYTHHCDVFGSVSTSDGTGPTLGGLCPLFFKG